MKKVYITISGTVFRSKELAIDYYGSEEAFQIALDSNILTLVDIDKDGSIFEIDDTIEYDDLPEEVKEVLSQCTQDYDYEDCYRVVLELHEIGWTADFDLSAQLGSFKKIKKS